MDYGPVLQHEAHRLVSFNDLLRRPAIRRETCFHGLYVLPRGPHPAFRVEMRWVYKSCGGVNRRSQLAETSAVNWATDGPGGLDLRLQCKVWRLVRREANAVFTFSIAVNVPQGFFERAQPRMESHWFPHTSLSVAQRAQPSGFPSSSAVSSASILGLPSVAGEDVDVLREGILE